jgi:hypothetical protein
MEGFTFLGKLFVILFVIAPCFICFYGATFVDPAFWMELLFFPMIIGFLVSIFYLIRSIIKRKLYPMVSEYIIIMKTGFIILVFKKGFGLDLYPKAALQSRHPFNSFPVLPP